MVLDQLEADWRHDLHLVIGLIAQFGVRSAELDALTGLGINYSQ